MAMKTMSALPSTPEGTFGPERRAVGLGRPENPFLHEGGLSLGSWFGIRVALEASWFVTFALLTVALAGYLAGEHPSLAAELRWTVALGTSALFFGSILLHELAHSLVARRLGLQVRGITLMLVGGVSHLGSEPKRPLDDLAIAAAGPLTSAAVGTLFLGIAQLLSPLPLAQSVASWLGIINLGLAAFNLLPGFPLDGGRALKALLWTSTGDPARAYRLAISAGKVVATALIFAGVLMAFGRNWTYDGLWIGFLGWYLLSGAQATRRQLSLSDALKQHQVRDVLRPPEAVVSWGESLAGVVDGWVLRRGQRTLLVCEGTRLLGMVTLHQIKQIPKDEWDRCVVGQIMIPTAELAVAVPEQNLFQAFGRMSERGVSQLPVVEGGRLIGLLGREDVLRVLAVGMEMDGLLSPKRSEP
jgi:Zn-dependent protease/predicted transcriptional regulator